MKNILVGRKVANETNVAFKGVYKGNIIEKFISWALGVSNEFTLSREELVNMIDGGEKFYTKNSNGGLTNIEVVNSKKRYLRSVSNGGTNDNLDSLPIYNDFN